MPEKVQQSTIKLPQFWPTDPDLWFAQAEAEFVLRNITSDQTKYSLLVQALDQETARRVRDVFKTPPNDGKYDFLKKRLQDTFILSEADRANKLLAINTLGDLKPSELMDKIQALSGDHGVCYLTKQIFVNALPEQIRLQLNDVDFTDPQKAARKADELWSTMQHNDHGRSILAIAKSDDNASEDYCFYHRRFGNKAKKCKGPCNQPGAKDFAKSNSGNGSASRN